VSIDTLCYQFK